MKNKLKIAVCAIFVVIFSLLPMSVFAYTDVVSPSLLYNIAKDSGANIYTNNQMILEDKNNYYLFMTTANCTSKVTNDGYPTDVNIIGGQASVSYDTCKCTFPKSNVYDVTVDNGKDSYYYDWQQKKYSNITGILYSNKDVIYGSGDNQKVFFQQMNSIPQGTSKRVPLNTTLSSIQLTGILDEVIALLPILFPVLITFLAIRKGIAFCLATLRAS